MKSFFRETLGRSTGATSIITGVLVISIFSMFISIVGVDGLRGLRVISLSTISSPERSVETAVENISESVNWRVVRMRVTAYCGCSKCCGGFSDGLTANMHKIQKGDVFAAADKKYAFGTELIVPGYNLEKPVKVMDRGGSIKGDRLDVFFNSHRQARVWGVRYLDVKVRI